MKSVFALFALAVAVSAQAPDIPACAASCFTAAALAPCTGVTDTTCLCGADAQKKITLCITTLKTPCSGADIGKLAGLASACSGAGASAPPAAGTGTEAAPTGTEAAPTGTEAAPTGTGTEVAPTGTESVAPVAPTGTETAIETGAETTLATETATATETGAETGVASGTQAAASGQATGGAERLAAGGSLAIAAIVAAFAL